MAVDPIQMMGGVAPPQGVSNSQTMAPPQAGGAVDPAMLQQAPVQQEAPPKPPTLIPTDVARMLAEAINNAKLQAANGLAKYMGDPRGNVNAKYRDMVKAWRKRNPDVDPLYEKIINGKSDEEITNMMYPLRRALIRYGRRTYTEQVEFAEMMAKMNEDPRFDSLDTDEEELEDEYIPPQSRFPSRGEESYKDDLVKEREEEEERLPQQEE